MRDEPTRAELVEMADENGYAHLLFGDGWKVSVPFVRPLIGRRSKRRDVVAEAKRRRRMKSQRAIFARVLATWERAARLAEIEAAMQEMVRDGDATYDPTDDTYCATPRAVEQARREQLVDDLHSRRRGL